MTKKQKEENEKTSEETQKELLIKQVMNTAPVFISLIGDDSEVIQKICDKGKEDWGVKGSVSLKEPVKKFAREALRLLPTHLTTQYDKPFKRPVTFRGINVRKFLDAARSSLPYEVMDGVEFSVKKIGVQKFEGGLLKTPREVVDYGARKILNKLNPCYLSRYFDYNFGNKSGVWFLQDVDNLDQVMDLTESFMFFYPVFVTSDDKDESDSELESSCFAKIKTKSEKKIMDNALKAMKKVHSNVKEELNKHTEDGLQNILSALSQPKFAVRGPQQNQPSIAPDSLRGGEKNKFVFEDRKSIVHEVRDMDY